MSNLSEIADEYIGEVEITSISVRLDYGHLEYTVKARCKGKEISGRASSLDVAVLDMWPEVRKAYYPDD